MIRAWCDTAALVDHEWDAIVSIASALQERGALDGDARANIWRTR